jgi:hypothetical protein
MDTIFKDWRPAVARASRGIPELARLVRCGHSGGANRHGAANLNSNLLIVVIRAGIPSVEKWDEPGETVDRTSFTPSEWAIMIAWSPCHDWVERTEY